MEDLTKRLARLEKNLLEFKTNQLTGGSSWVLYKANTNTLTLPTASMTQQIIYRITYKTNNSQAKPINMLWTNVITPSIGRNTWYSSFVQDYTNPNVMYHWLFGGEAGTISFEVWSTQKGILEAELVQVI